MTLIIAIIVCMLIVYGAVSTVIGWFSKPAQRAFSAAVDKAGTLYLQICLVAAGALIVWFCWKVAYDEPAVTHAQTATAQQSKVTEEERAWLKGFCYAHPVNKAC